MDCDSSFKIETVSGTVLFMNESQHAELSNQEPSKFPPGYRLTYKRSFWVLHKCNYCCKLWSSSSTPGHTHCNYQSSYLVLLGQIPITQWSEGIIPWAVGGLLQLCSCAAVRGDKRNEGVVLWVCEPVRCLYRKQLVLLYSKAKFSLSLCILLIRHGFY